MSLMPCHLRAGEMAARVLSTGRCLAGGQHFDVLPSDVNSENVHVPTSRRYSAEIVEFVLAWCQVEAGNPL
jgi:hypothetical protein